MATRNDNVEHVVHSLGVIQRKLMQAGSGGKADWTHPDWSKRIRKVFTLPTSEPPTPAQFRVLMGVVKCLATGGTGPTVKQLAEMLAVSSSAITQAIDRLADKGYLVRETAQTDRRTISIHLSPPMKKKMAHLKKLYVSRVAGLFSVLSARELEEYRKLNDKIVDSLSGDEQGAGACRGATSKAG